MKFVYVLSHRDQLKHLPQGTEELVLPLEGFSRLPFFKMDEASELVNLIRAKGLKVSLEWDILMTDKVLQKIIADINLNFFNLFSSLRVQDLGAFYFILRSMPQMKIQLILEHGNHNFESLSSFAQSSTQIERLVLSPQIPGALLENYSKHLPCPIEVLYEGPLMLSYTPRHLLARLGEGHVIMRSLEGNSPELQALDNQNGTLVMHRTRFSLENRREQLENWDHAYFRLDERMTNSLGTKTEGFFEKNQSSEVFVHLKNSIIEREDGLYAGEVIDVVREHMIGISFAHPNRYLKKGDVLVFKTPEGRIKEQLVTELWDFLLHPLEEAKNGDIVFIPHRGTVSVRSSVYFK